MSEVLSEAKRKSLSEAKRKIKKRLVAAASAGTLPMSSSRSAHDRLLALQKRIYRSLQDQATRLLGETPDSIRRYEREYREDFKRIPLRPQDAPKDELIREIRASDVSLIGDFHTFSQAQRTALRVLREAVQEGESWYLGLEMFPSHRQEALDRFQLGQLSEKKFLEEIEYEQEWGFPWQNYAPILRWAIENRVKLIALNRPKELNRSESENLSELKERDRWAAGVITDVFQDARRAQVKRPRMLVLYGELHIGRKHLPAELKEISTAALKKPLKTLLLHQNQDHLYWKLASQGRELQAEIIRLRKKNYCVLSSPPWAKMQSLINWAEGASSTQIALESAELAELAELDDTLDEIDPLSLMRQYAEVVAEFFKVPAPSFDGLDVYTIRNADFADELIPSKVSSLEKRLLRYHILHNHRIYVPGPSGSGIAYLAAPNENSAAEIASMHLFRTSALEESSSLTSRGREKMGATFYQWILDQAFGFLGSLILNPRRKCDLIADHEKRIEELRAGAAPAYPHELEARELAYDFLDQASSSFQEKLDKYLRKPALVPALYFAARYVGFALAKQVHHALLEEIIDFTELRRIFFGHIDEEARTPSFWRFNSLKSAALKTPMGVTKAERL
jgi:hypothetical protein